MRSRVAFFGLVFAGFGVLTVRSERSGGEQWVRSQGERWRTTFLARHDRR